jgi:hypothetical protein
MFAIYVGSMIRATIALHDLINNRADMKEQELKERKLKEKPEE